MYNVAIDSCSLFIPLVNLTEYSDTLTATYVDLEIDTGEISNPRNNATVKITNKGYNTYYKLVRKQINKEVVTGVQFSVNSKHLKHSYLDGITNNNVKVVYESIMTENIIKCSLADFKQALIQDVDVKHDMVLSSGVTFNDFTKQVSQADNKATGKLNLVKRYANKTNQGIEFGNRKTSDKLPYFKIYNKHIELLTNSLEFKELYNINVINNVRLEVNFKNRKMLIKYNLLADKEKANLSNVLNNLGNFDMKKVTSIYINGEQDNAKQARAKEVYEECKDTFKIAGVVELCVLLDMDLTETTKRVLDVHLPNKDKVKKYKDITARLFNEKFKGDVLSAAQADKIINMLKW